jgi:pyridoxal phosphate enzyme (YggS family)
MLLNNLQMIEKNIQEACKRANRAREEITLIAVSKTKPVSMLKDVYELGIRDFGENKVQELSEKYTQMPQDMNWHLIGHLQTNKLKMVLPYVSLVQSVDSERLLNAIQAWGSANGKVISVLLEPHVAAEETKQGFDPEEVYSILQRASEYDHLRFCGIMGMATFTDDESVIRDDFAALRSIYENCRERFDSLSADFNEFSIGMSDDYPIAISLGSTMIRIGSMIFGERG